MIKAKEHRHTRERELHVRNPKSATLHDRRATSAPLLFTSAHKRKKGHVLVQSVNMSMAAGAKMQFEPGSWLEAAYDVYIGALVGASHCFYMTTKYWYANLFVPLVNAFGYQFEKDKRVGSDDSEKTLKVVAVGYGRTGTYSLTLALDELGFPTLHTQHLYEHEVLLRMWTDNVFLPAIKEGEISMGNPDLQLIADQGYQATADLPMALYFEQIMEQFPDCKFILTTRENSDVWFRSWYTLTKSITNPTAVGGLFFSRVWHYVQYFRWLFSIVNQDNAYLTQAFPLPDQNKRAAIASYENHNRRVREKIPADRLLEYNVKQGWEPLCEFLEIPQCPVTPFPKTNSARSVQVQAVFAFIVPLSAALFIIFGVFGFGFKALTGMTIIQWAQWKSQELKLTLRRVFIGGERIEWSAPRLRKKC